MTFSEVLAALKNGHRAFRTGWGDKFVFASNNADFGSFLAVNTGKNAVHFTPTDEDIFAEDWNWGTPRETARAPK